MSRHHNPIVTRNNNTRRYSSIVTYSCSQHSTLYISNPLQVFDADGNGKISSSEFKDTLFSIGQRCNEGEIQELIAEIDNNRDGIISKEEFLSVFLNHGHFPANDGF
eukprot:sb/3477760/